MILSISKREIFEINERFINACSFGVLREIQELLENPIYLEYINIHDGDDYAFKEVCDKKHSHIINYFIFEMYIRKTVEITKYIEHMPDINYLFEMRELNQKLNNNLTSINQHQIYKKI